MRMLDLFAGRLGWTKAFLARGWEVVAVDLVEPPEIPEGCDFVQLDVMYVNAINADRVLHAKCKPCAGTGNFYRNDEDFDYLPCDECEGSGVKSVPCAFDFICASSPCEEFSVHGMKHFHPNPKYPRTGIRLFNHTRSICEASGVPYVMENVRAAQQFVGTAVHHCGAFYLWGSGVPPILPRGLSKGFGDMSTEHYHANLDEISPHIRANRTATIPPELAFAVADYATNLYKLKTERKTINA